MRLEKIKLPFQHCWIFQLHTELWRHQSLRWWLVGRRIFRPCTSEQPRKEMAEANGPEEEYELCCHCKGASPSTEPPDWKTLQSYPWLRHRLGLDTLRWLSFGSGLPKRRQFLLMWAIPTEALSHELPAPNTSHSQGGECVAPEGTIWMAPPHSGVSL